MVGRRHAGILVAIVVSAVVAAAVLVSAVAAVVVVAVRRPLGLLLPLGLGLVGFGLLGLVRLHFVLLFGLLALRVTAVVVIVGRDMLRQ
jgi:hypothetical protein